MAARQWKKIEDIFIRFDTTHERDRYTDRQTYIQTPYDGIGRTYASHRAAKTIKYTLCPEKVVHQTQGDNFVNSKFC